VTAALPLLKQAKRVEILTVGVHESRNSSRVDALKEYLGLHGVTATSVALEQDQKTVGVCLMDYAAKANIDLLVMGGYGHSHLREVLACGVTLDIVSEHAVPVFLMH